jgi:hypothetical protein
MCCIGMVLRVRPPGCTAALEHMHAKCHSPLRVQGHSFRRQQKNSPQKLKSQVTKDVWQARLARLQLTRVTMELLKFGPFSSAADPSFWHALTQEKLERFKLSADPVRAATHTHTHTHTHTNTLTHTHTHTHTHTLTHTPTHTTMILRNTALALHPHFTVSLVSCRRRAHALCTCREH